MEPPETASHLDHESRCETTVKVSLARRRRAWQRRGDGVVDRRGPARAGRAVDDLRKDVRAHAHALAEQHRLRRDDLLDAEHQVVADLRDEPGPSRPAVDDLAPHVRQERRRERERVPGPAHEERERPRFGARDACRGGWSARSGCVSAKARVPPETGASTICAPAAMTSAETLRATFTSSVVESMQSVSFACSAGRHRSADRTPLSSVKTARTCGDDGSIVIIVFDALTALS